MLYICGFYYIPLCKHHQLTQNAVSFVDGMQVVYDNEKLGHIHYTLTIRLKKVKGHCEYMKKKKFYFVDIVLQSDLNPLKVADPK